MVTSRKHIYIIFSFSFHLILVIIIIIIIIMVIFKCYFSGELIVIRWYFSQK